MGGGKGGGTNVSRQEKGYQLAMSGQDESFLGGRTDTNLAQGYWAGRNDMYPQSIPHFEMPDFSGMFEAEVRQREQQAAEQARLQEEYRKQQEIAQGTATLDQLFSGRLDAATRAGSEVEKQISDEFAHAQTRGLDYSVDDVQKQERINNLFAEYWGEGQEAEFTEYSSKYATDRHKWTLPTVRGVGPGSSGALPEATKVGGKVQKGAGTTLTEDDELGQNTLLGT